MFIHENATTKQLCQEAKIIIDVLPKAADPVNPPTDTTDETDNKDTTDNTDTRDQTGSTDQNNKPVDNNNNTNNNSTPTHSNPSPISTPVTSSPSGPGGYVENTPVIPFTPVSMENSSVSTSIPAPTTTEV